MHTVSNDLACLSSNRNTMIWMFSLNGNFFSFVQMNTARKKEESYSRFTMRPGDAMKIDAKILTKCKTHYKFYVQCNKILQYEKKESFNTTIGIFDRGKSVKSCLCLKFSTKCKTKLI